MTSPELNHGTRMHFFTTLSIVACTAALACPLIGYGYIGRFTRYVADDFCAGRNLAIRGFWGSQIFTYQTHSGRFFSYFARIGASLIGRDHETSFVPAILLVCWLASTTWALFQLMTVLKWRFRLLLSLLLGELVVFAMLRTGPDTGQSFYWQAGSFTYTVPIILTTVFLGLMPHFLIAQQNGRRAVPSIILAGILALCAAGCSETNAVFQCAGLALAVVLCKLVLVSHMRRLLPILFAGLLGSLLASVVVVAAPGNAVREAGVRAFSPALPKTMLLLKTAAASGEYIADFLHTRPLAVLTLLVVSFAVSQTQQLKTGASRGWPSAVYTFAGAWTFAFFLIFSAILPGMFAFSAMPPDRALFVDHWILLLTLMLTGFLCGLLSRRRFAESRIPGLLAVGCTVALIFPWAARSARDNLVGSRDLRRYAEEWDNEDAQLRRLRSEGKFQVTLPWNAIVASNGNIDQIGWISTDPTYFINTCTADYYGLKSLRTLRPVDNHEAQETIHAVAP